MLITQISDCHISWPPADGSDRLGDLEQCVAYVNSLDPQPDLVVHTGDVAHDAAQIEYDKAAEKLSELSAPFCVIPGNRDDRSLLRDTFSGHLPADCHDEFVQYLIAGEKLCVIMLDTLSYQSNKGRLCQVRLDHFKDMLNRAGDRPVVIFMHHQPFEIAIAKVPLQFEDRANLAEFSSILSGHGNVREIFCGHSHRTASGEVAGIPVSTITSTARDLRLDDPGRMAKLWPTRQLAS